MSTTAPAAEPAPGETPPAPEPMPGHEVELKFLLDEAAFKAAQQSDLLAPPRRGGQAKLRAVYFDTEGHDLAKARMVLRVRNRGAAHTMTLKCAATAANPHARREIEVPIAGSDPDPELFGAAVATDVARAAGGQPLLPCFITDIRRKAHVLEFRHSRIEVAFDTGTIAAGDAREAVREVELELKTGDPADLFALALDLIDTVPARLGVLSKAERGSLLARGTSPRAVRATSPLAPDHSVDDAIGEVIGTCIQQFTGNWPAFEAGLSPEPVHQMRVAMRRLRAALALFQRSFPSVELGAFRADAKRIASAMGEARNWDVFADMVRDGPQTVLQDDAAFQALLAASETSRAAGYATVAALIRAPSTTRFVLSVLAFVARRGWRNGVAPADLPRLTAPAAGFAAQHLDRLRRKVRKRGQDIVELPPHERHEVRIALKGLRYATDFFGALYPDLAAVRAYARATARLQDVLGSFNDMVMVTELVRRLDLGGDVAAARAGGVLIGWYGKGAEADLGSLHAAWEEFRKTKQFWNAALKAEQSG